MKTGVPGSGDPSRDVPWLVAAGASVGVAMSSLSVVGLIGRLTGATVAACLLVALGAGIVCGRHLGASRLPGAAWLAFLHKLSNTVA